MTFAFNVFYRTKALFSRKVYMPTSQKYMKIMQVLKLLYPFYRLCFFRISVTAIAFASCYCLLAMWWTLGLKGNEKESGTWAFVQSHLYISERSECLRFRNLVNFFLCHAKWTMLTIESPCLLLTLYLLLVRGNFLL